MSDLKKIYIIAGEASGDLHGSNVVKELFAQDANIEIQAWGGDLMQSAGAKIVKHIKELAFMGFIEVVKNLPTILKNIRFCKNDILQFKPDALLLIDYPGFNLRIAKWAKSQGIPVHYYISPQIWAWKQSRVHTIKKVVDHMYTILPFEQAFYKRFDYEVEYVGHPLLDAIEQYRSTNPEKLNYNSKPILAVLPGSRKQEVSVKLPIMLDAVKDLTNYEIVIAGAPTLDPEFYKPFMNKSNIRLEFGKTYQILDTAILALVTSGTATLETALFEVPQVVCYKGSNISYQIAKRLIKIKFISLVNLIMDREVVTELIQAECNSKRMLEELHKIEIGGINRQSMKNSYSELIKSLGGSGASKKVAQSLLKTIR